MNCPSLFDYSKASKKTKGVVIGLECLFISLVTGLVFGFGALKSLLISDQAFEWVCDLGSDGSPIHNEPIGGLEDPVCKDQNFHFTIMFSIGTLGLNCIVLPVGPITKYVGPKVTSIVALVVSCIGFVLMGLASQSFNTYYIAYAMIGAGGGAFFVTQFHMGNLFPGREGLIGSGFSGAFNFSSAVFLFLWYIYDYTHISSLLLFSLYAVVPAVICGVYITYPKGFVNLKGAEEPEEEALLKRMSDKSERIWQSVSEDEEEEDPNEGIKLQQYNQRHLPLSSQLLSLDLLLFSLSFAWSVTCFNFYISEVGVMMTNVATRENRGNDGSDYTLAFSWVLPFSAIFTVPLSGFVIDFFGFFYSMFLINIFALLSLILYFVPFLGVQPLAFFCVVEGLTLSFALGPSFMNFFVGVKNYSTIFGAVEFVVGIFSLFLVLFAYLSQHVFNGNYDPVISILIGVQVFTFASPIYFNYKNYQLKQTTNDEPDFLRAEDAKGNFLIQS